ncbi:MAG: glycosyltransferase family 2 protein [Acidipila sp.]|nr:glycosyltransferase family 2 protein [Acidipila sp.]
MPALDEADAIRGTLEELLAITVPGAGPGSALSGRRAVAIRQLIVVDNGSTDRTADVARELGAVVVSEPRRGYGHACLAGIAALLPEITTVVFLDADGSDDPRDLARLLDPIERGDAEMVLASRVLGQREAGALSRHQQLGNALATKLMRMIVGARYTDLGPFRAIRRQALQRLKMRDTNYGWTIEMQIKAKRQGLRVLEIPVNYRKRRAGKSKISGSLPRSVLAGGKILWTIARHAIRT